MSIGDDDHKFRASVIGASEIAVLFDASPWLTPYQLWHFKKGTYDQPEFGTEEYQQAGVFLEKAIVDWASHKWGYKRAKTPKRLETGGAARVGGHPDQMAICPRRGRIVLEIKTVDRNAFARWQGEPPLQYQLQAMAYAAMAGVEFADIVVLVGGNQLERFEVAVIPALWQDIQRRAAAFWQSIDEGREPPPDYTRDAQAIKEVYAHLDIERVDLTGDAAASEVVGNYLYAQALKKAATDAHEEATARLFELIGRDGKGGDEVVKKCIAVFDGFEVSSVLIAGSPDREADPGEIIKGRKSHRRLYVKKEAEE